MMFTFDAGLSLIEYPGLKAIDPAYALPDDVVKRIFFAKHSNCLLDFVVVCVGFLMLTAFLVQIVSSGDCFFGKGKSGQIGQGTVGLRWFEKGQKVAFLGLLWGW
ncbi:hypothetical protein Dsin_019589 [Dipteronia sinensis]|uniref:Uncharacterized protein n=1 Tax=Dipteronia sinensis TaxID=43782 RepID=A0AAE0E2Z0_9ROSI|nr:hypothetical protein Dsin_019589 [Dipteronia sinensis]